MTYSVEIKETLSRVVYIETDSEDMRKYLVKWMANTEGSERDRAVTAFVNLENGIAYTDTDVG